MDVAIQNLSTIEEIVIPRLAALLVTHGLQSLFNICLAHRHFALRSQDEQVVALKDQIDQRPVAHVFTNGMPDPEILRKYKLQMPKEACIIPETFLIRGGKLLPYEFTCIEGDAARQNLETIDLMQRRQDFLDGWTRVIKDHGLEDRLGLTIREEEDSNSDIPKVMVFDAKERVDILFSPTKEFPISVSPRAPPAEWEVRQGSRDGGYECARSRWCRDWICPYCGHSNSSGTICEKCGAKGGTPL